MTFVFPTPPHPHFGKTYNRTSCVFPRGDEIKSPNKSLRVQKILQRSRGPSSVLIHINSPNPTTTSLFLFMLLSPRNSLSPHSLRLFTLPLQWWAPQSQFSFPLHTAQAHTFILISSLGDKSCCRRWRRYSMHKKVIGQLNSLREHKEKRKRTWPCHEWKYHCNPWSPVSRPEVTWPGSTRP